MFQKGHIYQALKPERRLPQFLSLKKANQNLLYFWQVIVSLKLKTNIYIFHIAYCDGKRVLFLTKVMRILHKLPAVVFTNVMLNLR